MEKPMCKHYCLTVVLSTKYEKCEPFFTLQNLQGKVGSYISQLNSFSKVLQKRWQTESELDGVQRRREWHSSAYRNYFWEGHCHCHCQRQSAHGSTLSNLGLKSLPPPGSLFSGEQPLRYWLRAPGGCLRTLAFFQKLSCLIYGSFN